MSFAKLALFVAAFMIARGRDPASAWAGLDMNILFYFARRISRPRPRGRGRRTGCRPLQGPAKEAPQLAGAVGGDVVEQRHGVSVLTRSAGVCRV